MNELKKLIDEICADFQDVNALLAARSRELDRREAFNEELGRQIKEIKESREKNR